MRHEQRQSGPVTDQAASKSIPTDETMVALTGCPCGCVPGEPCLTERPVPDGPRCCQRCGWDELEAARRYGIHCAAGCVFDRLRAVVA